MKAVVVLLLFFAFVQLVFVYKNWYPNENQAQEFDLESKQWEGL